MVTSIVEIINFKYKIQNFDMDSFTFPVFLSISLFVASLYGLYVQIIHNLLMLFSLIAMSFFNSKFGQYIAREDLLVSELVPLPFIIIL